MRYGRKMILILLFTVFLLFIAWYSMESLRNGGNPPESLQKLQHLFAIFGKSLKPVLALIGNILKQIGSFLARLFAPLIDMIRDRLLELIPDM